MFDIKIVKNVVPDTNQLIDLKIELIFDFRNKDYSTGLYKCLEDLVVCSSSLKDFVEVKDD